MLSCKRAALMLSQSVDGELPAHRKPVLWAHLLICDTCTRLRKQLFFLKEAGTHLEEDFDSVPEALKDAALSPAKKAEIESLLQQEKK